MPNQTYLDLLQKMKEIHEKKSHDYAKDTDYYSNFKEAAAFAGVTPEQVFLVLLGVKVSRFRNLTENGKVPNNEGIVDTLEDLSVYSALLTSFWLDNCKVKRDGDICHCGHKRIAHTRTPPGNSKYAEACSFCFTEQSLCDFFMFGKR